MGWARRSVSTSVWLYSRVALLARPCLGGGVAGWRVACSVGILRLSSFLQLPYLLQLSQLHVVGPGYFGTIASIWYMLAAAVVRELIDQLWCFVVFWTWKNLKAKGGAWRCQAGQVV